MSSPTSSPMGRVETIHPPHREAWNVAERLNYNREGRPVPLDACEVSEFGLYTRRRFSLPHERVYGMATWLLPDLGLRVISWLPKPDIDPRDLAELEDYYLDIASVSVDGDVWRMVDYYLDVLVWTGQRVEVIDQDEFVAAMSAGHLDADTAEWAMATSYRAVEGLAAHGYDLGGWLSSAYGIELSWP